MMKKEQFIKFIQDIGPVYPFVSLSRMTSKHSKTL